MCDFAAKLNSLAKGRRLPRGAFGRAHGAGAFVGHTIANVFITLSRVRRTALLDIRTVSIMDAETFRFGVRLRVR